MGFLFLGVTFLFLHVGGLFRENCKILGNSWATSQIHLFSPTTPTHFWFQFKCHFFCEDFSGRPVPSFLVLCLNLPFSVPNLLQLLIIYIFSAFIVSRISVPQEAENSKRSKITLVSCTPHLQYPAQCLLHGTYSFIILE